MTNNKPHAAPSGSPQPNEALKPINIYHRNGVKYYQYYVNNELITVKA